MELNRHSDRSREGTPFLRSSCDRENCAETVHKHTVHSRRHESKITTMSSTSKSTITNTSLGALEDNVNSAKVEMTSSRRSGRLRRSSRRSTSETPKRSVPQKPVERERTSDYSSEESEYSQRTGAAAAFDVYKQSGEWWNAFPKTDYTYSRFSPHRREILPGVINMPNMSRKGIHSGHAGSFYSKEYLNHSAMSNSSQISNDYNLNSSQSSHMGNSFSDKTTHQLKDYSTYGLEKETSYKDAYSGYSEFAQHSTVWSFIVTAWSLLTTIVTKTVTTVTETFRTSSETATTSYKSFNKSQLDYESDQDEVDGTLRRNASSSQSFVVMLGRSVWSFFSTVYTKAYEFMFAKTSSSILWNKVRLTGTRQGHWWEKVVEWMYWVACSHMVLDCWLMMKQHSFAENRKRLRDFLPLLLLPILLALGWWALSGSSSAVPVILSSPVESVSGGLSYITGTAAGGVASMVSAAGSGAVLVVSSAVNCVLYVVAAATNGVTSTGAWIASPFLWEASTKNVNIVSSVSGEMAPGAVVLSKDDLDSLAERILHSEAFQRLTSQLTANEKIITKQLNDIKESVQSEIASHHSKLDTNAESRMHENKLILDSQSASLEKLSLDMTKVREQMEGLSSQLGKESSNFHLLHLLRKELQDLKGQMRLLQLQQNHMLNSVHTCCGDNIPLATVEEHVASFLANLFAGNLQGGNTSSANNGSNIPAWIRNYFVAHEDLESRLSKLAADIKHDLSKGISSKVQEAAKQEAEHSAEVIMATVTKQIMDRFHSNQGSGFNLNVSDKRYTLTDDEVKGIVHEALLVYDADKTGMVDYALESSGGSIVSTRCTETYQRKTAVLSLFGIPLWYPSNNPRTVIQPGVHPGECWAFKGSQGYVVIQLSGQVKITAFSLEHIPKALSPKGKIDSAPKDFSVWGLKYEKDVDPLMLGKYRYDQNGKPLQYFIVKDPDVEPFQIVELRIESNHGNVDYTCLYRFRVHGVLMDI